MGSSAFRIIAMLPAVMPIHVQVPRRQPPVDATALTATRAAVGTAVQALQLIRNTGGVRQLSPASLNAETCAELNVLVAVGHVLREVANAGCHTVKRLHDQTLVARDRDGNWQVVAEPVAGTFNAGPDHLFRWLVLDAGHVPPRGQATAWPSALRRLATVEQARQGAVARMATLLAQPAVHGEGFDAITGYLPLQGQDLRGISLPANLAARELANVNLAGQDLSGHDLRGAVFRGADLRGVLLPQDLRDVQFLGSDLCGAQIDTASGGSAAPRAWPDFSAASMAGGVVDASAAVHDGSASLVGAGHLLDARSPDSARSLVRSLHTISAADIRRDALDRVLVAVAARRGALAPDACLLDVLFGEHGSGQPEARHRYAASLASLLFEPGYSSDVPQAGIDWLRAELASELAEQARAYSRPGGADSPANTNAVLVSRTLQQAAFPPALRHLALHANPELNG